MRNTKIIALSLIVSFVLGLGVGCSKRAGAPGSKANPIRFYFMPLKGETVFKANAPVLKQYLEANTSLSVETINAPDFISIVKAFRNGQADAAFMNTLGYLMARDWASAEAKLISIYGDLYKTYRGEILAQAEGNINSPADLNGKTVVLADPFSASGYLYVLKYFQDNNIKPAKTIFAKSHKDAVAMLYNGQVDAAATYHNQPDASGANRDARAELLAEHPDVFARLKIIATTDEIPNGPVAFSGKLPTETKTAVADALMKFSGTVEGRNVLTNLYNITGLAPANNSDYDAVGGVIKKLGKTTEEVVPGGITFYRTQISPILEH